MKRFFLILSSLFVCISMIDAIDPAPPHVIINLTNNSNLTIDSVFAYGDTSFNYMPNSYEKNFYSSADLKKFDNQICCSNWNHYFKIKVRFADSTEIYSNVAYEKNKYGKFDAIIDKNKIDIKKNYDEFISNLINIVLYLFFASFIFKVLIYLMKFEISNKLIYSIKYTTVNFLNLLLMYFAFDLFEINYCSILILIFGLTVPLIVDSYLHKKDKNIIVYSLLTLKIVNMLFYTIGLFVLVILWLILKIL